MIELKYKTVPGGYWVEWAWQILRLDFIQAEFYFSVNVGANRENRN